MWIERKDKKNHFIQSVTSLKHQVLILRGARQVGKTSFVLNALKELSGYRSILIDLSRKTKATVEGIDFYGRDFFGSSEDAEQLLHNISLIVGDIEKIDVPVIIFIDEADRHPISLETIQTMASYSSKLKVIYTGSNLENVKVKNAATGRKQYFDLYPVSFSEFLSAHSKVEELRYFNEITLKDKICSQMFHDELNRLFDIYMRLGGMPKILSAYIDPKSESQTIQQLIVDLVQSIEENVKTVLEEKTHLYEYEDVLKKVALLSMETLKFSRLQVQHAKRADVKKLVNKTVGARVAHKIRLYDSETDLSKYIISDPGILNYLLNGSDLLLNKIIEKNMAIQYETAVANEIIANLATRDDLLYWKSKRGAQVEFMLKSPHFIAIDVKSTKGDVKSLDSCAIFEKELEYIIKISKEMPSIDRGHIAKIPALELERSIPLITIPHYLASRIVRGLI